ncbi:MAG: replication-relaxation family protein [Paenisporosarcina sp.]|nr:replication-relaxation family protein [Paenisporosarcina sp.]
MNQILTEPRIHLPKEKRGVKGIVLSEDDYFVMKQLCIHYSMDSKSLHALYTFIAGGERNSNSITNRLRKLVESGVLVRRKELIVNRGGGIFIYHYRLGRRGLDVLVQLQYITEQEANRVNDQAVRLGVPAAHTKATSKLVNNVFMSYAGNDSLPIEEIVHLRGSVHPLFGGSPNIDLKGLIIPDWVVERDNIVICLEVDTVTERRTELDSKYKRYIKLAEEFKLLGKVLIVVFAVVDETVTDVPGEFRLRRVASIKEYFPIFHEWPENIHFYSMSANRVPGLVSRVLSYREPTSPLEQTMFMNEWLELILSHSTERQPFIKHELDSFYDINRDKRLDAEFVFSVPKGRVDRMVSALYVEEGSVRSHQLIRTNLKRNESYNERHADNPLQLLVCYGDEDLLQGNVNGLQPISALYETDFLTWRQWDGIQQIPQLSKVISPYKREMRDIE